MRRISASACLILFLVLAPAIRAADADDGEDPRIAEIRRRLEQTTILHARQFIGEQANPRAAADATMVVGTLVTFGRLGHPNPILGMEFFRQASEMGSAESDCAIANLYASGVMTDDGQIPRDPDQALQYFEKAVAGGSVPAMLELGNIYAEGKHVDPDSKKALSFFMEAAKRGDTTALDLLKPVMLSAKEWEEARPGRKANFPTSPEEIIQPELARQHQQRNAALDRLASRVYVEVNKRVAASTKGGR